MEINPKIEIVKHDYRVVDDLRNLVYVRDNEVQLNDYIHHFPKHDYFKNKKYRIGYFKVDIYNFFCTCGSFTENSLLYKEERDIKRCCRHIFRFLFGDNLLFTKFDSLTIAILKSQFFYGKELYLSEDIDGTKVILGYREISDLQWISVYTTVNNEEDYRKFGYNLVEKRWRHDVSPPNAEKITSFAQNSFIAKRNSYFKKN